MASKLLRTLKIDLVALARCLLVSGDHSFCFDDEVVMEVYRHVVVTGLEHGVRWRHHDPWSHRRYEHFGGRVGYNNSDALEDLKFAFSDHTSWRTHATRVITRVILGDDKTLARWRRDQGSMRHAVLDVRIRRAAGDRWLNMQPLLSAPRLRRLTPQFNSCHEDARLLHRVLLIPTANGWELGLRYGCLDERQPINTSQTEGSHWLAWRAGAIDEGDPELDIPEQADNEPTGDFIRRCSSYVASVTTPIAGGRHVT